MCKEITPVSPNGKQFGIFISRTAAEVEAPVCWLPHVKRQPTKIGPDAGKD